MYAVIRTGGKQYRVAPGDVLEVEKLDGEVGDTIELNDVLMVVDSESVDIGRPVVDDATVTATITGQYRGEKVRVFRFRPKKRIRVTRGHRQYLTRLEIKAINGHTAEDLAAAETEQEPEEKQEPVLATEAEAETSASVEGAEAAAAEPVSEQIDGQPGYQIDEQQIDEQTGDDVAQEGDEE